MSVDRQQDQADAFIRRIEELIGRALTSDEVRLAHDLAGDKTPEIIARELQGAPIIDPKKIRPEHKDTANE